MVETVEILNQVPQCPVPFLQAAAPQPVVQAPNLEPGTSHLATPVQSQPSMEPVHGDTSVGTMPVSQPMNTTGIAVEGTTSQNVPMESGMPSVQANMMGVLQISSHQANSLNNNFGAFSYASQQNHQHIPHPPITQNAQSCQGNQVLSAPATLPVTQLPSGGAPQGGSVNVVDDDDFADFQAAPPPLVSPHISADRLESSFRVLLDFEACLIDETENLKD